MTHNERAHSSNCACVAAPVLTEEAGPLPVRDFLPAIGAHISEPARFPSHADEVDYLKAVSEELRTLRAQTIDHAQCERTIRGVIHHALGYIGQMRLENERERLTPKQVDAMLFSLARDLRKAVEA